MSRRVALSLWMLAALLVVTTLTASGIGALRLPISLLWNGTDESLRQIRLTIRLPRVLLALAIGGSLALAGCVMQGLFRNPLADPGLLGISSGAALAVALWVVLPLSLPALVMLYAPMLAAFLGALAATFVIFLLSRQRDASLSRLLLVGIAINALCGAAVGVRDWCHLRHRHPAYLATCPRVYRGRKERRCPAKPDGVLISGEQCSPLFLE